MCDKVDEKNCQFRRVEIYYIPIISLYPYIPIYIYPYIVSLKNLKRIRNMRSLSILLPS